MRVSRALWNAAEAAGKPKPMSADHTLYHVQPKGFWKKFRDAVVGKSGDALETRG